jgi:hypothetical protein
MAAKPDAKDNIPVFAELANLIGSLDVDMGRTSDRSRIGARSSSSIGSTAPVVEAPIVADQEDYTVVHFGSKISFKGEQGRYLAAQTVAGTKKEQLSDGTITTVPTTSFALGMNGQGIGELEDCFVPINVDSKEDSGPIRYGTTVVLKSVYAKERCVVIVCRPLICVFMCVAASRMMAKFN